MDKLSKHEADKISDSLLDDMKFYTLIGAYLTHQVTGPQFLTNLQGLINSAIEDNLFIEHGDFMDEYKKNREAVA